MSETKFLTSLDFKSKLSLISSDLSVLLVLDSNSSISSSSERVCVCVCMHGHVCMRAGQWALGLCVLCTCICDLLQVLALGLSIDYVQKVHMIITMFQGVEV